MGAFLIIVGLIFWLLGGAIYYTIPEVDNVNLAYGKMWGARFMAIGSMMYLFAFVYLNHDGALGGHYIFALFLLYMFVRYVMREFDARMDFIELYNKKFPKENEEKA